MKDSKENLVTYFLNFINAITTSTVKVMVICTIVKDHEIISRSRIIISDLVSVSSTVINYLKTVNSSVENCCTRKEPVGGKVCIGRKAADFGRDPIKPGSVVKNHYSDFINSFFVFLFNQLHKTRVY